MLTLRGPKGVRRGAALRDLGIIVDGSVLIRDGTIAEVGSTRRLENLKEARAAIEIPANGRIIAPGFIDPNLALRIDAAHPADKHFHARKRLVQFQEVSLSLLRSCLQHGTLTAEVKASGREQDRVLDFAVLRKLADIGANPICMVRTWHVGTTSENELDPAAVAVLAKLAGKKLIRFVEFDGRSGHATDLQLISALAGSGIGIKLMWQGGSSEELLRCLEQFRPTAVYCVTPQSLSPTEINVLGAAPSITVLGAGKQIFEGPPLSIGREMVDAGAAIALSSGYDSGSAASYSMQMSLALAVVRLGLTAEEAFAAATINAAYAAGRGDLVGSIETGKRADLLLLNAADYRDVPGQFGVNHVDMAIRDGNIVLNRTRWKAMHN